MGFPRISGRFSRAALRALTGAWAFWMLVRLPLGRIDDDDDLAFTPSIASFSEKSSSVQQHVLDRRTALRNIGSFGLQIATTLGLCDEAAWAIKDARKDALCTYKCLQICNDKAPNNEKYCADTCP